MRLTIPGGEEIKKSDAPFGLPAGCTWTAAIGATGAPKNGNFAGIVGLELNAKVISRVQEFAT